MKESKDTFPSNCLIVALWFYLTRGGYLVMRKSRLDSILPHFFWVEEFGPETKMKNFVPIDNKPMKIPPPLFEGYIKTHDRPDED